jgi:hypothetical protein
MRADAGVDKIIQAVKRDDSTKGARTALAVDGVLDTAIGLGSAVTCGAMAIGAMTPHLRYVAEGTLALAVGRIAVGLGKSAVHAYQESHKTVSQKLAEAELLKPNLPGTKAA